MKNSLKTEILRLKRQLFGGNMSQSNSNNLTLFDYADIISSSVTDLENKRRLFAELLNDTESEADKEYQNTVAEIKDACAWLDKIISQFSNPDEGFVRHPIKFCVNNNPSSNNKTADCGVIRLSDLPRVNFSFLSAKCYARLA